MEAITVQQVVTWFLIIAGIGLGWIQKLLFDRIEAVEEDVDKCILHSNKGTSELKAELGDKIFNAVKAVDKRLDDMAGQVAKISEIEKEVTKNTTEIEWLKRE